MLHHQVFSLRSVLNRDCCVPMWHAFSAAAIIAVKIQHYHCKACLTDAAGPGLIYCHLCKRLHSFSCAYKTNMLQFYCIQLKLAFCTDIVNELLCKRLLTRIRALLHKLSEYADGGAHLHAQAYAYLEVHDVRGTLYTPRFASQTAPCSYRLGLRSVPVQAEYAATPQSPFKEESLCVKRLVVYMIWWYHEIGTWGLGSLWWGYYRNLNRSWDLV